MPKNSLENKKKNDPMSGDVITIEVYDPNFLDGFEMDYDTRKTYEAIKKQYLGTGPILSTEEKKYESNQAKNKPKNTSTIKVLSKLIPKETPIVKKEETQIQVIVADKSTISFKNNLPHSYSVTYTDENGMEITIPISKTEGVLYWSFKNKYMQKDGSNKPYNNNPEMFRNLSRRYFKNYILYQHPDYMELTPEEESRRLENMKSTKGNKNIIQSHK